jgi:hypothetical protein
MLLKKAIKRDTVDIGVYKPGDYVRIRDFKPDKLGPKYTDGNKAYSKKEDLRAIVKPTDDRYHDFKGVYMIHSVQKGIKTGRGAVRAACMGSETGVCFFLKKNYYFNIGQY